MVTWDVGSVLKKSMVLFQLLKISGAWEKTPCRAVACRERHELAGVLQDVAWNGRRHRCTFNIWAMNQLGRNWAGRWGFRPNTNKNNQNNYSNTTQ